MKYLLTIVLILITSIASAARVTDGIVAYYDFSETTGTIIKDRSNVLPRLDLTIPDPAKVDFLNPGIRVKQSTIIKTSVARDKLKEWLRTDEANGSKMVPANFFSDGITIEIWVKPANNTQSGPARIVTFSQDSGNRNFTLGQQANAYQQRFRTSTTNTNGTDFAPLTTSVIASTPVLQHVVFTRDSSGVQKIYIDGVENVSTTSTGNQSTWNYAYDFGLFNETNYPTDDRTWLGEMYIAAIYGKALTQAEITQNYNEGHTPAKTVEVELAWDANTEANLGGYRVHYGLTSRFNPANISTHDADHLALGEKWCGVSDSNCINSFLWYCTCETWDTNQTPSVCTKEFADDPDFDYMCDRDYFQYDDVVDVGNVLEFTIYLPEGIKYYLAAGAYNDAFNPSSTIITKESPYSLELTHTSVAGKPNAVQNIKWQ